MSSPHIITIATGSKRKSIVNFNLQSDHSLRETQSSEENKNLPEEDKQKDIVYQHELPPLHIYTARGGELEIETVFQKNLRIAKLCHTLGLPEVLTEWKFPKAQVSARPDFSKVNPTVKRRMEKSKPEVTESAPILPSKYHVEVCREI